MFQIRLSRQRTKYFVQKTKNRFQKTNNNKIN